MAFVVEDGTGLTNSNAYIDIAFADTFHSDRNRPEWAALTVSEKEAVIIRATDYIDKRFGRRFRGFKESKDQALEWPRLSAFDNDDYLYNDIDNVPRQLQKACAEYALRAITNASLAPDNTDVGFEVTRSKVGPIEVENTLASFSAGGGSSLVSPSSIPDYPEADLWIEELLTSRKSKTLVRG